MDVRSGFPVCAYVALGLGLGFGLWDPNPCDPQNPEAFTLHPKSE